MAAVVAAVGCGREGRGERASRSVDTPAASAASDAPSASAETSGSRRTITFMGTSLTAGYGLPDPDSAYPALLQRRIDSLGLSYDVVNAGVSGETSAGARRRLPWTMKRPADVFVLETGANDGLRGLSVDSLRSNIQAIIDSVRRARPAARIVLVGMEAPPNLGARYARRFRSVYPELARKNHLPLVPFLLEGVAGVDTLNQGDGIHPNVRGEHIVADNVWRVLGPLLEQWDREGKARPAA